MTDFRTVEKYLDENKEYLFIDPYDPVKERWTGKRITPDDIESFVCNLN